MTRDSRADVTGASADDQGIDFLGGEFCLVQGFIEGDFGQPGRFPFKCSIERLRIKLEKIAKVRESEVPLIDAIIPPRGSYE